MSQHERRDIILQQAKNIAREYGHGKVTLEHLVSALIQRKPNGKYLYPEVGYVLDETGVDVDRLEGQLHEFLSKAGLSLRGSRSSFIQTTRPVEEAVTWAEYNAEKRRNTGDFNGIELLSEIVAMGPSPAARILAFNNIVSGKLERFIENKGPEKGNNKGSKKGGEPSMSGYDNDNDEPKGKKEKSKTPALDAFGSDFTTLAEEGKLDPVVGRDTELERITQILARRTKNNPVIIGEAGVGKTAIAEGLAQLLASDKCPAHLKGKRLISLDLAGMVAGTKYRGEFEERIKAVMKEVAESKNVLLFLDELHTLVGAGSASGSMDAANILKPALARGEVQLVGATTLDEYRKHIENDGALERRLQKLILNPPSPEATKEILRGQRKLLEAHHKSEITDEAIDAAVDYSERYITDRNQPDKALDIIDEAASRIQIINRELADAEPDELKEINEQIEALKAEKDEAVQAADYDRAADIRTDLEALYADQKALKKSAREYAQKNMQKVTAQAVIQVVAKMTGIPVDKMGQSDADRMLNMEAELGNTVVGQEKAAKAVAKSLRRAHAGLKDPNRPIGSFLFVGPTGVGKTLLCKALSEFMFDDKDAMIRIDMSEYMEKFAVSRLIGAPPGYVGYEEGGKLTEAVRRKPYSVILLDEVEKAHPDVFNLLLQMLEEGQLTDSLGRRVDFRNTVVVMTSNIGSQHIQHENTGGGFGLTPESPGSKDSWDPESWKKVEDKIKEELLKFFRPELINRVDKTVVFRPLDKKDLEQVIEYEMRGIAKLLKDKSIKIEFEQAARDFLIDKGYQPQYGARPLRRVLEEYVQDPLSEALLRGDVKNGDTVTAIRPAKDEFGDDKLIFSFNNEADPANDNKKSAHKKQKPSGEAANNDKSPRFTMG